MVQLNARDHGDFELILVKISSAVAKMDSSMVESVFDDGDSDDFSPVAAVSATLHDVLRVLLIPNV